jgi:hypothetical protein
MKRCAILVFAPLVLLLSGCPLSNVTGGEAPQVSPAPGSSSSSLTLVTDTSRNQAVLVTGASSRVDVTSVNDDGTSSVCVDATALAPIGDASTVKSLSSSSTVIVVGTRSDGNAGAWVYASGKMQGVIDEDSGRVTSTLPPVVQQNDVFRGAFGWVYHVMGVSEDGKVIAGYAENKKGFHWGKLQVDPGTTVGVYWRVSRHPVRPYYLVSHARIIGVLDQSKLTRSGNRMNRWISWIIREWLDHLKLFLIDDFTSYLVMVDKNGIHFDSANNIYDVTGTDQDNMPAVATIDKKDAITITEQQQNQAPPSVFAAGSYFNGAASVACIWVDGAKTDLPGDGNSTHGSNAYAIAVANGVTYVAGSYFNGTTTIACYWVDGVRTDLPGDGTNAHPANAYSIFVSGGTVYTSGYYNNGSTIVACYWTGTAKTDLPGADGALAQSVFVSGGTVYTAGQYNAFGETTTACYWTGTTKTDLPGTNGAAAQSVFVSGGAVYLSGEYNINGTSTACYWTGTTRQDLPGSAGSANSIFVSGGTVYTTGQYQPNAAAFVGCFWTGTAKTDLMTTSSSSESIFVSGSTVYTAGYYSNGSMTVASYWTGTAKTDLPGTSGQAMAIVVQ